jgi:hypothetical protein
VPHFLHTLKTLEDFEYAHFIHYNTKLFVPTHLSIHFQWWGQGCICIIIETDYIWTTKVGLFYVIFNFSLLISSVQLSRITQFFFFFLYLYIIQIWKKVNSKNMSHYRFSNLFSHSWLITWFVIIITRWVPLVEQEELLNLLEHLSSNLFLCLVFCISLFIIVCRHFVLFHMAICIVGPSSIYGFWLPPLCLHTFLSSSSKNNCCI